MRACLLAYLIGCGGTSVKFVGSSCADPATCTAECDTGVVVACDRGGEFSRDPTEKAALFRKGYVLWLSACDFGNPEACLAGATDSLRSRGRDRPTRDDLAHDVEACPLLEVAARGQGTPLVQPCP